jgi:TolB protein
MTLLAGHAAAQAPPPGIKEIIIDPRLGKTRIAVPDCFPRAGDEIAKTACKTITEVLRSDLRFEDLGLLPEANYGMIAAPDPDKLRFEDWKAIGAQLLVITRAQANSGELVVELRVYAVESGGQSVLAKRYADKPDKPRVFAHQAADDILGGLANIKGVARSKIAFASDRDSQKGKKTKEIYLVDYDGWNPRRVTTNRALNILPAFSPDGRMLAYISFRSNFPELMFAWIFEGRSTGFPPGSGQQLLGHSFSPDGKKIAYASNKSGNMDIWIANVDGTDARRLTTTASIDTAPFFSPTGNEIAFTSARSGTPQIWVMDTEGLNPRRVTTVGNYNDAPAWNPAKEYSEIAYTSRIEGRLFDVAVVDVSNGQVRQITAGRGSCEYPTWAPNGRHLAFSCERGGRQQLGISDRIGRTIKVLDVGPGSNSQPDWGQ